jgi:hypothetical protein
VKTMPYSPKFDSWSTHGITKTLAPVAQLIDHLTTDKKVGGSSPSKNDLELK